jgi:hypothetical protein
MRELTIHHAMGVIRHAMQTFEASASTSRIRYRWLNVDATCRIINAVSQMVGNR